MPNAPARRRSRRWLAWALALVALAFVVRAVPIDDRCVDPIAATTDAKAPRVPVTRRAAECVVHRATGDEVIAIADCAKLTCEPGMLTTVRGARVDLLLLLVPLYVLSSFVWASRWRALLLLAGAKVTWLETWRIIVESLAGGVILPGGVGGDALRVGFVVARGGQLAKVLASVLLDRVIGLVTLSGLAAIAAASSGESIGSLQLVLASIPVGFAIGIALLRSDVVARTLGESERLRRFTGPLLEYVRDPGALRAIAKGLLLSCVASAIYLALVRGIVGALGVTVTSERGLYVGTTMAFVASAIPALPGGWGTSDAAFVFFLAKAGLAAPMALATCLVMRLYSYGIAIVGAIAYVSRQHAGESVATRAE